MTLPTAGPLERETLVRWRDGLGHTNKVIFSMPEQFEAFTASELYCTKCCRAQPVRERLLLVLLDGELHECLCSRCGTSLGKRTVSGPAIIPTQTQRAPRRPAARRLLR
jgi:hypothetical protein